jgi:hypothetical protein
MAVKADLRSAMRSSAKAAPRFSAAPDAKPESAAGSAVSSGNPHFRPGRANKSNVTGYFDAAVKKQLRLLAAENDTTIQGLLAEALNDLFAKYRKPEIAAAEDK